MTKYAKRIREIDDANLDPYQFRLLMHIFRVGECWENLQTTATKCGMSIGKASQVRRWLLSNGWLRWTPSRNGNMALVTVSPHEIDGCIRSPHETEISPHETVKTALPLEIVSPHELEVSIPIEVVNLSKYFTHIAGVMPNPGTWDDKWQLPLMTMLERAGSVDKVKDQIKRAVELARDNKAGKRYTIVSPQSIINIVANLQDEESKAVEVKAI